MNTAQQIMHRLGIADGAILAKGQKNASHRKAGPGREHIQGNGSKTNEQKRAGAFGRGLRNWITNKQRAALANQ